jgi:hypothetical protein
MIRSFPIPINRVVYSFPVPIHSCPKQVLTNVHFGQAANARNQDSPRE